MVYVAKSIQKDNFKSTYLLYSKMLYNNPSEALKKRVRLNRPRAEAVFNVKMPQEMRHLDIHHRATWLSTNFVK